MAWGFCLLRLHGAGAVALALTCTAASAGTVTVVTSLSQEMVTAYRQAFERQHPGILLDIVAKNTADVLHYVEHSPADQRPDLVWASSIDAFDVLARKKLLQPAPQVGNPQVPAKIGAFALNDAQGRYFGQSLAAYGIMWNTDWLRQRQLPAPKEWADLARPEYQGMVAMSAPARSGTMHLMVEGILQGEGWEPGWSTLLQMAGNAAEITVDSLAVPRGVGSGQYGLGMVIDAFGLAGKYSGLPVDFVYPSMTAMLPASIGLLAGARNPQEAQQFMAFTLSSPGQQLLLDNRITRLPVLPPSNLQMPAGYPDPYEVARRLQLKFNPQLSGERYPLVSRLFDQMVTLPFAELQAATLAIQLAEQTARLRSTARGKELIAQARKLAYTPVLSAQGARDAKLLAQLHAPRGAKEVPTIWLEQARSNYRRAQQLAEQARAAMP